MSEDAVPAPLRRLRATGRIACAALLLAAAAYVVTHLGTLDAEAIRTAIARYPAAPAVFLLVHVVASLVFFPRTVLGVAAGALFGLWWGALWAALGSVVGAVAGFLVARYLNSGLIDLESLRRFGPILIRAERGGWRAVAALRLIPVIPHSVSNYALGLTRLPIGAYAFGSLLGQLPMTIASTNFGAAGEELAAGKAGWVWPTVIGVALLVLSALLPKLMMRRD